MKLILSKKYENVNYTKNQSLRNKERDNKQSIFLVFSLFSFTFNKRCIIDKCPKKYMASMFSELTALFHTSTLEEIKLEYELKYELECFSNGKEKSHQVCHESCQRIVWTVSRATFFSQTVGRCSQFRKCCDRSRKQLFEPPPKGGEFCFRGHSKRKAKQVSSTCLRKESCSA